MRKPDGEQKLMLALLAVVALAAALVMADGIMNPANAAAPGDGAAYPLTGQMPPQWYLTEYRRLLSEKAGTNAAILELLASALAAQSAKLETFSAHLEEMRAEAMERQATDETLLESRHETVSTLLHWTLAVGAFKAGAAIMLIFATGIGRTS